MPSGFTIRGLNTIFIFISRSEKQDRCLKYHIIMGYVKRDFEAS